ncbi:MAG: DUF1127 domain-containing protein [Betaproteobacteria bacterium]|nr:DUF1127 domain-containing protein [Betaproteobacteria bacterium]MDH5220304.1 DUF1127 domain-containing protein [Betaproteobacteria bacterium]MDH5350997.1 DUF1127 domain-containing protein [Betaproteobacteria bacterium]
MNQAQRMSYPWTEALAEVFAGAWHGMFGALDALREARARAAAVGDLQRLSDRTLRDIGLHRSQIRSAVYGGRS